jgi:glycosyltransferase involved in cell wall biosynthesis
MNALPTVSVVLPTYNRDALVQQAVRSVLRQTFGDWELIVVDDGSTDDTRAFVVGLNDPRVQLVPLAHSGNPAWARNAGLARARGEWIAFLDSDDFWLPPKLERQLAELRAHPNCRWSCTGFGFIDEAGAPTHQRSGEPYRATSGWILESLLAFAATASTPTLVVRRSLLDDVGGFDETLSSREDYDMMLRLASHAEICALPDSLTLIREHAGRTTKSWRTVDLYRCNERVFRKTAETATSRRVRSLCRRQCANQLVAQAIELSRGGEHASAAAAIARAARDAPASTAVWRAAASCARRAALRKL